MRLTDFLKGLSLMATISAFALPTHASMAEETKESEDMAAPTTAAPDAAADAVPDDAAEGQTVIIEGGTPFGRVAITESDDGERLLTWHSTHRLAWADPLTVGDKSFTFYQLNPRELTEVSSHNGYLNIGEGLESIVDATTIMNKALTHTSIQAHFNALILTPLQEKFDSIAFSATIAQDAATAYQAELDAEEARQAEVAAAEDLTKETADSAAEAAALAEIEATLKLRANNAEAAAKAEAEAVLADAEAEVTAEVAATAEATVDPMTEETAPLAEEPAAEGLETKTAD